MIGSSSRKRYNHKAGNGFDQPTNLRLIHSIITSNEEKKVPALDAKALWLGSSDQKKPEGHLNPWVTMPSIVGLAG